MINGKVVVITGAGSGIGEATATRVAQRGARVVLGARDPERLDAVVAGLMPISPLDALRVDDWEAMVDVNLEGALYGIAAALPVFRQQGFGHFVHTASTAA